MSTKSRGQNTKSRMYYIYRLQEQGVEQVIVGAIHAVDQRDAAARLLTSDAGVHIRVNHGITVDQLQGVPANEAFHSTLTGELYSIDFYRADGISDSDAGHLWRVFVDAKVPVWIRPVSKGDDAHCVVPRVAPEWYLGDFGSLIQAQEFCTRSGLQFELIPA